MKKTILITGGSGLLAVNWAIQMRQKYHVVLLLNKRIISIDGVKSKQAPLGSVDDVCSVLDDICPDIVIHTVGLTSVELCESNPAKAYMLNTVIADYVAAACSRYNIKMVHISTDHLFSGENALVDEQAIVQPRNEYGRTKAEAENRVLEVCPGALVIRTNFFAWGTTYRKSFSDMIINHLRANKEVKLFTDVFYTPILIEALVAAVHELIAIKESGIFHVVGDERLSKYEFGVKVAEYFQQTSNLLQPCLLADRQELVCRPFDMSLSNAKVCRVLGHKMGSVNEQLQKLYLQEKTDATQEVKAL